MTVRFGLVGLGRWGWRHAAAIQQTPGASLAAIAVRSPETAQRAAAEFGVPVFTDYRQLLAAPLDLDVVDVVTPNALHAEVALAALERGKHVLVEKPLATTLEDCAAIAAAAARAGRMVAVGHELRVSPLWERVKAEIQSGRIGRVLAFWVHLWRRSFRPGASGWRWDPAQVGSWVLEELVHFFDLARWYLADCGEPLSVYARANGRSAVLQENLTAIVTFPGESFATISQTTAGAEHHVQAQIVGTEAALRVLWSGASDHSLEPQYRLELAVADRAEEVPLAAVPTEIGDLQREIASLVRCLERGTQPPATAEDGRWAVRLCLAAEASARAGHEVKL